MQTRFAVQRENLRATHRDDTRPTCLEEVGVLVHGWFIARLRPAISRRKIGRFLMW
jgi:hypothetical protein